MIKIIIVIKSNNSKALPRLLIDYKGIDIIALRNKNQIISCSQPIFSCFDHKST